MPVVGHASDSTEAAQRLRDLGAAVIVTLGGDGTNRVGRQGVRRRAAGPHLDRHQQRLPAHGRGHAGRAGGGTGRDRASPATGPAIPASSGARRRLEVRIDGKAADMRAHRRRRRRLRLDRRSRALGAGTSAGGRALSGISACGYRHRQPRRRALPASVRQLLGRLDRGRRLPRPRTNRDDPDRARTSPRSSHRGRRAPRPRRHGHAWRRPVYARARRRAGDRNP